jgi:hypothetical protein
MEAPPKSNGGRDILQSHPPATFAWRLDKAASIAVLLVENPRSVTAS